MSAWALVLSVFLMGADDGAMLAFVRGTHALDQCVMVLELEGNSVWRAGPGRGDGPPKWSPDGSQLAFSSRTERGQSIVLLDVAKREFRALPHELAWNAEPAWSPRGDQLAYVSGANRDTSDTALTVFNLAKRTETRWGPVSGVYSPAWMPNANLILALDPDQQLAIEGVDMTVTKREWHAQGALLAACLVPDAPRFSTELTLITQTQSLPILPIIVSDSDRYAEYKPVINRQGDRVAYESNDGGDREIYMLGRRGIVNVSNHRAADWNPQWSRDGKTLIFESFRHGRRGIYRVFSDTALVMPVAISESYDCWDPSSSGRDGLIAYVANKRGVAEIYQCRVEDEDHALLVGTATAQPGNSDAYNIFPAWRP